MLDYCWWTDVGAALDCIHRPQSVCIPFKHAVVHKFSGSVICIMIAHAG